MAEREWTQEEIDEDMFREYDGPPCPRCDGHRTVACHCGGDLCFRKDAVIWPEREAPR